MELGKSTYAGTADSLIRNIEQCSWLLCTALLLVLCVSQKFYILWVLTRSCDLKSTNHLGIQGLTFTSPLKSHSYFLFPTQLAKKPGFLRVTGSTLPS